jgi:hypothetical protein
MSKGRNTGYVVFESKEKNFKRWNAAKNAMPDIGKGLGGGG